MKARLIAVLASIGFLAVARANAQPECASWQSMPFAQLSGPNGADSPVEALCVWASPQGAMLVAAGSFTHIQGVAANNVAARNPATGQWQALGSGTNGTIRAAVVYNGDLIVAGLFTQAGGQSANYIARWDGTSWHSLGSGMGNNVYALTVYNGELIAAGYFINAGGGVANHIARWNGTSWQQLGTGINDWVISLAVYGGELVAGGYFSNAGGVVANRIAKWNGSAWSAMGSGCDAEVITMTVFPGALAVGGRFTHAGGLAANRIASWNGSWHTLSTGMDAAVLSTMSYRNELIAGGAFLTAGGTTVAGIAKWTGSGWVPLDLGMIGSVDALYPWGDVLVVGGSFTEAGAHPASEIATWDGYEWGSFGGGVCNSINAMTTFLGHVIAGGDLQQATTLGPAAHNLVGWNGLDFNAYQNSMDASVYAFKSFKYSGVFGSNELIAGGAFLHANGVPASHIARYHQGSIANQSGWEAMGAGFNSTVLAIERHNDVTYAGGTFVASGSTLINRIARWNETTDVWEPLGGGMNNTVLALKSYNGELYAGGAFTFAGGVSTGGLARWNGTSWRSVGGFVNGTVYSLEVHNGELIIGGSFAGTGGAPNLARWNGTSFSNFGIGGANNIVRVLLSTGPRLYMGGDFTVVNGNQCRHIAYWNGIASWFEVDGGANSNVYALAYFNNELHAGGAFNHLKNDLLESRCWAKYPVVGAPWIADQNYAQTVADGGTATFTATPATGYDGLYRQWYHYDFPLADGPSGSGSTIGGAHSNTLTITNVGLHDGGAYRMVLSSACGADTSFTAQLNAGTLAVADPQAIPTRLAWLGPNPAHGLTQLEFSLAHEGDVRVRVLDVAGRQVRELEAGRLRSGVYHRSWDARDRAGRLAGAGLYFVTFEVDGQRVGVRRLTLVR